MGKHKDGHSYMNCVGIIRKIEDIPELKFRLIDISESKSHKQMSKYSLLLAEHILKVSNIEKSSDIAECFEINLKWQDGKVKFQDARNVAFKINRLASEEKDPVRVKVLRAMGQVAATPHVKWHALIASDYAITLINLLYPNDLDEVRKEREIQIGLMKSV
ncbi:putative immunity protein [Clostridium omnivorum]|uniref:Imm-5-like domain-containing protein n=1 Tax=Clostridium omnivorum TaxID=1604902 RepID=A0ABQ5N8Z2_9CLOT|nr:hypothetical protein [Clostridium sp. E14]GLC31723.1 hypothetical protein bsdE14_31330 [Clostridium sp. E14]